MDNNFSDQNIPQKKNWLSRFIKKLTFFVIIAMVLYLGISYLMAAVFVYSKGNRIGYIYKFSNKGYFFKTYEGILKTGFVNIGNSQTPNEEWNFSVIDDSVANRITSLDQRISVKLYYKEYYSKLFFRGETKYFVYRVDEMPSR
jgi:hypothetical protein